MLPCDSFLSETSVKGKKGRSGLELNSHFSSTVVFCFAKLAFCVNAGGNTVQINAFIVKTGKKTFHLADLHCSLVLVLV